MAKKNAASKTIQINCKGSSVRSLSKLQIIQGELKSLSPANEAKLRKRIEKYGFDAPIFIWRNKILDGTQRKIVVEKMLADGWTLPGGKVPVCEIKAKNLDEAKQRLLGYVSQYGKLDEDGLDAFLETIEVPDLETLDLPDFDMSDILGNNDSDHQNRSGSRITDDLENYMSFVVTTEQRAEIEQCLNSQDGENPTEQLLCLVRQN
jgi:hypothetical protein